MEWDVNDPVVTVVIPTYCRPDLLIRAVRGVLNQTYRHVRARVFDNGSGDDTARVIAELMREDARVEYSAHPRNIGVAGNFRHAIAQVDTPFFVVVADDDLLLPAFLEEAVAELRKHPEAQFHCSRSLVYNELARGVRVHGKSWQPGVYAGGASSAARMLLEHFITTGVLFRSSVRDTVGDFTYFPVEREFVARAAGLHPFTVSDSIGGVLVVHDGSFSAGVREKRTDLDRIVGVVYARDCFFSALTGVLSIPSFSLAGRTEVFRAAMHNARKDTLYHLAFKDLTAGDWEQIDEALLLAKWLGFGLVQRAGLRILRLLGRLPIVSPALVFVARFVSMRIMRSAYEPFERTSHRWIVEYVRSGAAPVPVRSS